MADTNPTIWVITLNMNGLNKAEDGNHQAGFKKLWSYYKLSTKDTVDSQMQID